MYVYQLVRRNKENPNNPDRKQYWEVAYDDHNPDGLIDSLKRRVSHKPGIWRIYRSVNKRNMLKAKLEMIEILTKSLVYPDPRRIETIWRTVLMQPRNKETRHFLLDVDMDIRKEELDTSLEAMGLDVIKRIPTPNGWHVITHPFDARIIDDMYSIDVKKDAFLFIERFEVKE